MLSMDQYEISDYILMVCINKHWIIGPLHPWILRNSWMTLIQLSVASLGPLSPRCGRRTNDEAQATASSYKLMTGWCPIVVCS